MVRLQFTVVKVALLKTKTTFFCKKFAFYLVNPKKCSTFAPSKLNIAIGSQKFAAQSAAFFIGW